VLPTFPAHVGVTGVLTLVKSGLSYTFGVNFQNVAEETNVSDMSKREVLVQDTDTGAFWRVKLTNLPTGQTDWGSIQNKPTEFPPSPIADGQVLGNVSGSTGVPVGVTLSALLDKISNTRGAVLYRGASGWAALGAGTAGQVLTSGGAGADPSWQTATAAPIGADALGGFRNKIINGDGRINQRGASSGISDDEYAHDRHYALTQSADITVSTLTAPADGIAYMMRLTQSDASAQRMGYAQILEAAETYGLRGKTVTLGGKLRYSNAAAVRFAVLEWTGTADTVTSDVVLDWTSGTYTAGDFFLASNLTVAAVGSITPSAATITDWSLTATISSSANNIIVFYWTEGTAAQNSTLDMRWYLVEGDATAEDDPFSPRHIQQELALCQRYYYKASNAALSYPFRGFNFSGSAVPVSVGAPHPVKMRSTPSVSFEWEIDDVAQAGSPGVVALSADSWSITHSVGAGSFIDIVAVTMDAEL